VLFLGQLASYADVAHQLNDCPDFDAHTDAPMFSGLSRSAAYFLISDAAPFNAAWTNLAACSFVMSLPRFRSIIFAQYSACTSTIFAHVSATLDMGSVSSLILRKLS